MIWERSQTIAAVLCVAGFLAIAFLAPAQVEVSVTRGFDFWVEIDAPFYSDVNALLEDACGQWSPQGLYRKEGALWRQRAMYICGPGTDTAHSMPSVLKWHRSD